MKSVKRISTMINPSNLNFDFGGKKNKQNKTIFGCKVDSVAGNIFITECMNFLKLHGLKCEGIFRIAGQKAKIEVLKQEWENGTKTSFSTKTDDTFDVAAMLKMWFREIKPEPILTFDMYSSFIAAMQDKTSSRNNVYKLLDLLPIPNMLVLAKLFAFLHKIASQSHINKMTPKNLAICFGPNLLFAKVETADIVIGDAIFVTDLTAMLIEQYDFFFKKILLIVNDLEDDDEDIITEEERKSLSSKDLKEKEKKIKEKREERLKKKQEEVERERKLIEEERKKAEEEKKKRIERKRQMNQQWEERVESSLNLRPPPPDEKDLEEERKREEERRKKKEEYNKQWGGGSGSGGSGGSGSGASSSSSSASSLGNEGAQDWYRSREERERAKKRQIRLREEREAKERLQMEEQIKLKKQMEENFVAKVKARTKAQTEQRDDVMAKTGMSAEQYNDIQQKKALQIKTGQYTYDELMEWTRELERYMEKHAKQREKRIKQEKKEKEKEEKKKERELLRTESKSISLPVSLPNNVSSNSSSNSPGSADKKTLRKSIMNRLSTLSESK